MNENMTFEQQLARLEEIVAALEKGDAPRVTMLIVIFLAPFVEEE